MRYAQYNNSRIEPQKGIKGAVCPVCGAPVDPKCGEIKIHHWAHKSGANCDPWWESETEWHRKWKDCFPSEWQEFIMHDEATGEKHVADVRSEAGLVIEFQHSSIKEEERTSREKFYKNMLWVVDSKEKYDNFKSCIKNKSLKHCNADRKYFYADTYDVRKRFPEKWLNSTVPVIFDFGIHDNLQDEYHIQTRGLWCIFPEKHKREDLLCEYLCGVCIKKDEFIERIKNKDVFFQNIAIEELREEERKLEEQGEANAIRYRQETHERIKTQCAEEKPWREAIQSLKDCINEKGFKPIRLFIKEQKITDYKNSQDYSHCKCMVLGIKSYEKTWNQIHYIQHDALILIESKKGIIPAIVAVPKVVINFACTYFSHFNYRIVKIEVFDFGDTYKIDFDAENSRRIFPAKNVKENLDYIEQTFSKNQDFIIL